MNFAVYTNTGTCSNTPAVNQTGVGIGCQFVNGTGVSFYAKVNCSTSGNAAVSTMSSMTLVAVLCTYVLFSGSLWFCQMEGSWCCNYSSCDSDTHTDTKCTRKSHGTNKWWQVPLLVAQSQMAKSEAPQSCGRLSLPQFTSETMLIWRRWSIPQSWLHADPLPWRLQYWVWIKRREKLTHNVCGWFIRVIRSEWFRLQPKGTRAWVHKVQWQHVN